MCQDVEYNNKRWLLHPPRRGQTIEVFIVQNLASFAQAGTDTVLVR